MNTLSSKNTGNSCAGLIQGYLDKYGWTYELIDQDVIVTGFSMDENVFTMFIRCSNDILYFSIPSFASSPNEECALKAYQYLLEANLHLVGGKFALGENGEIGFFAEFPVSVVSYDFFSFILQSIGINAIEQLNYVSDVSHNPLFISPYNRSET
jgi:hypothetical protein